MTSREEIREELKEEDGEENKEPDHNESTIGDRA